MLKDSFRDRLSDGCSSVLLQVATSMIGWGSFVIFKFVGKAYTCIHVRACEAVLLTSQYVVITENLFNYQNFINKLMPVVKPYLVSYTSTTSSFKSHIKFKCCDLIGAANLLL